MNKPAVETSNVYTLKEMIDYASGAVVSKIVARNDAGNITLFAFDQGQNLSEHTAPFDAVIQVLEGEVTVTINKKDYLLKEGELIIMPADVPHAVDATQKFKMLLTMLKSTS